MLLSNYFVLKPFMPLVKFIKVIDCLNEPAYCWWIAFQKRTSERGLHNAILALWGLDNGHKKSFLDKDVH